MSLGVTVTVSDETTTRDARLRAVGTAFLRLRPWIVAPMMVNTVTTLALSGAPRRQVGALAVMFPLALGFFVREAVVGRRRLVTARELFTSLVITLAGISLACVATGGIASPVVPMLFAPTVIAFAAFGRSRESDALFALLALIAAGLALLPSGVPFPRPSPNAHRWMLLVCALDAALLLRVGVAGLSDAYATAQRDLSQASDALVDAAHARTRTLETLGAQVAHEIKNPLAAVRGLVELLLESATESRQRRRLEVAAGEVSRIERIVHDYLSFARPLSALDRAPMDLGATVSAVARALDAYASRKGVSLSAQGPALPATADARRVKDCVLNLCLNAIEATPSGGSVALSWAREGDLAVVVVRDSGPGLDSDALAKLGTPFYTTREGGTGLGVHLARQGAEQHGGSLTFTSARGEGTVATLRIPCEAATHDAHDPAL